MRSHVVFFALVAITIMVYPDAAYGDTTYTYTGNNFDQFLGSTYNTSMSVSGSFTLSAPLPRGLPSTDISGQLLSYTFTDDVQTRTEADSYSLSFKVATDIDGQITTWGITVAELPQATVLGEIRDLIDTNSTSITELDRAGTGSCSDVVNGACTTFSMTDYGEVGGDAGDWVRTGDVPPTPKTYTYEGNYFDDFGGGSYSVADRVEAEFTLATPLAPNLPLTDVSEALISFVFFDGVHTRTIVDSYVPFFRVSTDGTGAIAEWDLFVVEGPPATANGEIRQSINTGSRTGQSADIGAIGICNNIVNGICVGFANTDYGQVFDDAGDWDGPSSSPATADYTYVGNNYTYIEGTSYDLSMNLSGAFSTAEPLPSSMAMAEITHTVTGFSYFDGVETRTPEDSWGWKFRVETDADGDISRWIIHLQEEPEATSTGERRLLVDSFSFWIQDLGIYSTDQAGYGDCTDVINGTCTTFVLDDYGSVGFDPGGWSTTVVGPVASPIPTLSALGAVILAIVLAALGIIRLWRI